MQCISRDNHSRGGGVVVHGTRFEPPLRAQRPQCTTKKLFLQVDWVNYEAIGSRAPSSAHCSAAINPLPGFGARVGLCTCQLEVQSMPVPRHL